VASSEVATVLARLSADAAGGAREGVEALGLFRQGTTLLHWNFDHILQNDVNRTGVAEVRQAIRFFERAVQLNPGYARAHAALAQSYSMFSEGEPGAAEKMTLAANRALALDQSIAPAHALVGYAKFLHEWDFGGVEQAFARALELQPRLLGVHRLSGDVASMRDHKKLAAEAMRLGRRIFPDSPGMAVAEAAVMYHAGVWKSGPDSPPHAGYV